jgi:hypothetical protein
MPRSMRVNGDDNEELELVDGAVVRTTKGKDRGMVRDDRDSLPFELICEGQPRRILGNFRLNAHTQCGDVVEVYGSSYKVNRVRSLYKYTQGRFVMFKKIIETDVVGRTLAGVYIESLLEADNNPDKAWYRLT